MRRFLATRVAYSIFAMIAATMIVFSVSRVQGDPRLLYAQQGGYGITPEQWEELGRKLNLDKPLPIQYVLWLGRVIQGDLGRSLLGQIPVTELIRQKITNTLQLGLASWLLATALGVPIGILSAVKRATLWDYFGRGLALIGQAAPAFWIGIMFILIFAVRWEIFPFGTKGEGSAISNWKHFVLPTITLGFGAAAGYMRLTRSAMLEVLDSEFVKLARAKGVREWTIVWKHAFKNALIPPLTLSALILVGFVTGTVVVETVFSWPGLGKQTVDAVYNNDFPVITGTVLL
ncbi:MAG: ABC transporter permease, partial [Chloroflexi bacterium]|nr:ABC transporter permease [Chloroflexota bacterium]